MNSNFDAKFLKACHLKEWRLRQGVSAYLHFSHRIIPDPLPQRSFSSIKIWLLRPSYIKFKLITSSRIVADAQLIAQDSSVALLVIFENNDEVSIKAQKIHFVEFPGGLSV